MKGKKEREGKGGEGKAGKEMLGEFKYVTMCYIDTCNWPQISSHFGQIWCPSLMGGLFADQTNTSHTV